MKSLREVDGELIQNWYIAALSSELPENSVLGRTIYNKHFVLFRSSDGTPRALKDRCLHRGAKLSEGTCVAKGIKSPYNGWIYDPSGRLIEVPSEGSLIPETDSSLREKNWKVPAAPVFEQDGVIWIWAGMGAPTHSTPPWKFPYAGDSQWKSFFIVTDFENEVTPLLQHFMDAHRIANGPLKLDIVKGGVRANYTEPKASLGSGLMDFVINSGGGPNNQTYEFIFPNIVRSDSRFGENGFVMNSQCTPIDRYKTRVYTWIAYRGNWLASLVKPFIRSHVVGLMNQNVSLMNSLGANQIRFNEEANWKTTSADNIPNAVVRLRELGVKGAVAPVR